MTRYPDETLEHYADRFVLLRLSRHGVTLPQYLANVARFERLALEAEPPLATQHAAILRIWAEQDTGLAHEPQPTPAESPWTESWQDVIARCRAEVDHHPQRNGQIVEPLHHHRHPRRAGSGFIKRSDA